LRSNWLIWLKIAWDLNAFQPFSDIWHAPEAIHGSILYPRTPIAWWAKLIKNCPFCSLFKPLLIGWTDSSGFS
jgi:hypothetical protein